MHDRPKIDSTRFGAITIDGGECTFDVIIRRDGRVQKRLKALPSAVYGTSHIISVDEARHTYESGDGRLIVGTGHAGLVRLSAEAFDFLEERGCEVESAPTPEAARAWNEVSDGEHVAGLFHVTC